MLHRQLHLKEDSHPKSNSLRVLVRPKQQDLKDNLRPKLKILRVHVKLKHEHCKLLRMKLLHGQLHLKTSHGKLFELNSFFKLTTLSVEFD